jgi:hypothetical protein
LLFDILWRLRKEGLGVEEGSVAEEGSHPSISESETGK